MFCRTIARTHHHRSNSTKGLTENEEVEADEGTTNEDTVTSDPAEKTSPSTTSSLREKFFFGFSPRKKPPGKKEAAKEEETPTGSVNDKYFYKLAVNEGLGRVDNIDSSNLNLHTPSECDYDSFRGISAHSMAIQFNPAGGDQLRTPGGSTNGRQLAHRLSTKKTNRLFAWKLFSGRS